MSNFRRTTRFCFVTALLAAVIAGCDSRAAADHSAAAETATSSPVTVQLDTPVNAACSALRLIQQEDRAAAAHDKAGEAAARSKLRSLGAWKTIRDDVVKGRPATADAMQTFENLLLDSWASVSMFYIDGIDFDKAEIYTQAGSRAVVRIPAHREQGGRNYHTAFSVECVRQQDATWLVTKVAFLGRKGESAPPILEVTSMPTTNPSDAPAADR